MLLALFLSISPVQAEEPTAAQNPEECVEDLNVQMSQILERLQSLQQQLPEVEVDVVESSTEPESEPVVAEATETSDTSAPTPE
jgi:hypothetical protein